MGQLAPKGRLPPGVSAGAGVAARWKPLRTPTAGMLPMPEDRGDVTGVTAREHLRAKSGDEN